MHYVYVIKSKKNNSIYIGYTNNLVRRLKEHNAGASPSTKRYIPWSYAYFEGYLSKDDAIKREYNLKYRGKALGQLKNRIYSSLKDS